MSLKESTPFLGHQCSMIFLEKIMNILLATTMILAKIIDKSMNNFQSFSLNYNLDNSLSLSYTINAYSPPKIKGTSFSYLQIP